MRNPNYTPTLTRADYNRIRKYAPARNHLYCFLLSLLQEILSLANSEQENNVTWFAMAVFEMGRETGIREERHRRRAKSPIPSPPRKRGRTMTEPTTRAELTAAIVALLDKADFRKLHLVWVYASRLMTLEGEK